jgi:hypothetical protein
MEVIEVRKDERKLEATREAAVKKNNSSWLIVIA